MNFPLMFQAAGENGHLFLEIGMLILLILAVFGLWRGFR